MALGVYFMLLTLCAMFGTSVQQSTCPDGWSQVQNMCYLWGRDRVTWGDANTRCADQGGILAEPDTWKKIEDLLQVSDNGRGWVGASDGQTDGTWIWNSSRNPVDSSLFTDPQPNDGDDNENCLLMNYGVYAQKCSWRYHYYCQKPATV